MKKRIRFQFEGNIHTVDVERSGDLLTLEREGRTYTVTLLPEEGSASPRRPVPAAKKAPAGQAAARAGDTAPAAGTVAEILAQAGEKVDINQLLLRVK